MKKLMDFGAIAGFLMIFLSAGYYDTRLLAGAEVSCGMFVPTVIGTLLLAVWLNGKAVRRWLRRVVRALRAAAEQERSRRAAPEYRQV